MTKIRKQFFTVDSLFADLSDEGFVSEKARDGFGLTTVSL